MARETCPNETITVQLHYKHVLPGKESVEYLSTRSPKTTPYKVYFLSLTAYEGSSKHLRATMREILKILQIALFRNVFQKRK